MAMEVTVHVDVPAVQGLLHHRFDCKALDELLRVGVYVLSVEVETGKGAAVVTDDHTVGIQHRDDLEYKFVSQFFGLEVVSDYVVNQAFHDPTSVSFSWMYPSSQDNRWSLGYQLRLCFEISHDDHIAVISSKGFTERRPSDPVFVLDLTDLLQVFLAIGVSVGVAVGYIDLIIVVFKVHFETQAVEVRWCSVGYVYRSRWGRQV
jgi:hypothetical protein